MNCDLLARPYRLLEYLVFGRALERRRREYIEEVADARRVLILGDGDGRFTAEFLSRNATAIVDSLDLSSQMLRLAQERIRKRHLHRAGLRFRQGDARTAELPEECDLIVSHFFLDCFTSEELQTLISRLSRAACPQARWLISEFQVPHTGMRRFAGDLLIKAMYLFFRVSTGLRASRLPDHPALLARHGFRRVRQQPAAGGLLISELWERP
jgi:ubiquinone/menaquinone biosynthesis C-methylase UbiE